jgi:tRNA/tmRNA/rRNA uracil-C5-methylase (TrmA/RlmC/RlmD family)
MSGEFRGEIAAPYERYRHRYPAEILAAMSAAFGAGVDDLAVDLECGTGQLTLPLAAGVGAVLGIDPEADMLTVARRAAQRSGVSNVSWMLGTDRDMPALRQLLGGILSSMVVDMRLRFRRP